MATDGWKEGRKEAEEDDEEEDEGDEWALERLFFRPPGIGEREKEEKEK